MNEIKYSVVFGNDHKNPLGALQSLGQAGVRSIAVCWGAHTGTLESSIYLKEIHFGESAEDCIDILLSIVPDGEVGVITPCCDEAAITLDKHRDRLRGKYRFEFSTEYSFEEISDKAIQTRLAKEAGLKTPEFFTIHSLKDIPEDVPFPCIIKPLVAMKGSKNDLMICQDKAELIEKLTEVLPHNQGIIIQRYIDKEYEILIECCRTSKGVTIAPAIIKNELNRLYPSNVGLSGLHEVMPFEDDDLRRGIEKLLDSMGYVGLISVEFAKSQSTGEYFFFEFNIRNDGYNPCMTRTGVNVNYYYVCDMLDIPFEVGKSHHAYIISEVRHLQLLVHGKISIVDWIKDIKKSEGFTWRYEEDKKPFRTMLRHYFIASALALYRKLFHRHREK